ncbi:hypothetical protein [Rhizobium sp. RAF56]
MQTTTATQSTIPQHVLDRIESEWRQMGERRDEAQKPSLPTPRR